MIAQWMLAAIAISLALSIAGSCAIRLAPRFGVSRRWVWLAVMVVSIALPLGMALRAPPPEAPRERSSAQANDRVQPSVRRSFDSLAPRNDALLIGWGTASLALILLLGATQFRARAQVARWRHGTLLGHDVAVSPDYGPAAVGLIRARVVLPEWVFDLPPEEQRLVLRHELEHIDAGDRFVLIVGVVMAVAMPWNLALWWQLRRLRVAMELDCDARVAPRAADRPRYGQLLLGARTQLHSHRAALAFLPTPSVLAERLHALLDSPRLSPHRVVAWGAAALAAVSVVTCVPVPSLQPAASGGVARPRYDSLQHVVPVNAPGHPRYDSLVPYVQSPVGTARGVLTGGGTPRTTPRAEKTPKHE